MKNLKINKGAEATWKIQGCVIHQGDVWDLNEFGKESSIKVGDENILVGRENDYKVCKNIVMKMLRLREENKNKAVLAYIKFEVEGEGTKGEVAYLRVTIRNQSVVYEEEYYKTKPSDSIIFHPRGGGPLTVSEEQFKAIGMGRRILNRLLRFKASIKEELKKEIK